MSYGNRKPDPLRCKERVHDAAGWGGMYQCQRKHKRDGYCTQHHPEAVAKRRAESDARYEAQTYRRNAPYRKIAELERKLESVRLCCCACATCKEVIGRD